MYKKIKKQVEIIKEITWNFTIIMPNHAKEWNYFEHLPKEKANINIKYINVSEDFNEDLSIKCECFRQNISVPRVQNVLIGCIYVGINAGFKNIYIFGADHSWHNDLHVNSNNTLCCKDPHFYDNKVKWRVFYEDYAAGKIFTMKKIFHVYSMIYGLYEQLEYYSSLMGTKIYNMTENSYIDAFERKTL